MITTKELEQMRNLYANRMGEAQDWLNKLEGKPAYNEWVVRYYMVYGKVEILNYLLDKDKKENTMIDDTIKNV